MNLKELAGLLGLSQATVSRALNGYPEVSKATRERVLAVAKEYGYAPNARARGLATGRANAIAHVISIAEGRETLNPVFCDFIAGANEVYSKHGIDMMLSLPAVEAQDQVFRSMKSRATVDGVVLHWPVAGDRRIELLTEIRLPFVVHGWVEDTAAHYSWVDVDNRELARRATQHLLELGHRRIALINAREIFEFAANRKRGYEDALAAYGIAFDEALHDSDEMTENNGFVAATRMLEMTDPPSAFFTSSVILAWGARRAVETMGLRLASDVSIITHDDALHYLANTGTIPPFTAMRSSVRKAGNMAAEMLIAKIQDPNRDTEHRLLKAELVSGASTGVRGTKGCPKLS